MKSEYHKSSGENISQWIERLVPAMMSMSPVEVRDIVTAISKESYFAGANAERRAHAKMLQS